MRRGLMLSGSGIGIAIVCWLAASLWTADYCSKWNPFSCHGPDPEMMKYTR